MDTMSNSFLYDVQNRKSGIDWDLKEVILDVLKILQENGFNNLVEPEDSSDYIRAIIKIGERIDKKFEDVLGVFGDRHCEDLLKEIFDDLFKTVAFLVECQKAYHLSKEDRYVSFVSKILKD